ncbi:AAA family ATPase [Citrifermentans bremense]|uniref:AAA family ATPase n=1 Tax=Citrifermentans bremense TaxID=60035 RepID=UPI0004057A6D|nr:AAA family ATPase [Citrifermentans bremense]
MYLNFYNLDKEPFQITPDPAFLYLSSVHKEALASIIYGVEKRKGFILITGAVGVGKTTILRAYLENAEAQHLKTIYLFNANISYLNLLKYIFAELNMTPQSNEVSDLVNQLHQRLLYHYREGRNILLVIDEAQNMPVDTLENLRMLSNFETDTDKLIQIVFCAQSEFEKTLSLGELKQLKQRIAVKATISPLTREEGITYIHHRLKTAGDKDCIIFTNGALNQIVQASRGIPRVINVLCDNSLITAFGYGKKRVGCGIVREITRDFGLENPLYVWCGVFLLMLLLMAAAFFGVRQMTSLMAAKAPVGAQATVAAPQARLSPISERTAGDNRALRRVVQRGDTLAKMIKEVYGEVDAEKIRRVKEANPSIVDENVIVEGGVISFPYRNR